MSTCWHAAGKGTNRPRDVPTTRQRISWLRRDKPHVAARKPNSALLISYEIAASRAALGGLGAKRDQAFFTGACLP